MKILKLLAATGIIGSFIILIPLSSKANPLKGTIIDVKFGWIDSPSRAFIGGNEDTLMFASVGSNTYLQANISLGYIFNINKNNILLTPLFSLDFGSLHSLDGSYEAGHNILFTSMRGLPSIRYNLGLDLAYQYESIVPFIGGGAVFVNPNKVDIKDGFGSNGEHELVKLLGTVGCYGGGGFIFVINNHLSFKTQVRFIKFFASKNILDVINREEKNNPSADDRVKNAFKILRNGFSYLDIMFGISYGF